MSHSEAAHMAHLEREQHRSESAELAAYNLWMSAMAELDRAGRLDRAGPTAIAAYRNNLACLLAEADR